MRGPRDVSRHDARIAERPHSAASATPETRAGDRENAVRTLTEWAARVGYGRVWLESDLIEIPAPSQEIRTAAVRCIVCRSRWSASTLEFWMTGRDARRFPPWCPRCGCELPQGLRPISLKAPCNVRRRCRLEMLFEATKGVFAAHLYYPRGTTGRRQFGCQDDETPAFAGASWSSGGGI
jgi:hypothetical protein